MKIRIVTDKYCGYEVQIWRWYWLSWVQLGGTNTHITVKEAELYAYRASKHFVKYVNLTGGDNE